MGVFILLWILLVGLGLYIVKTILEQHREHIYATSEEGLTTFTFTMTLAGNG